MKSNRSVTITDFWFGVPKDIVCGKSASRKSWYCWVTWKSSEVDVKRLYFNILFDFLLDKSAEKQMPLQLNGGQVYIAEKVWSSSSYGWAEYST